MANARIGLGLPYTMTYRGAMSLDSDFCLSSPNLRQIRMHAEQLYCNPRSMAHSAHLNDMMLHVPIKGLRPRRQPPGEGGPPAVG
jgi:hypothetical protein